MTSPFEDDPQRPFRRYLSKVPEVTAYFWVLKILAAAAAAPVVDFLATTLGLGLAVTTMLMITMLAVLLVIQLAVPHYLPWLYGPAVVLTGLVGTLVRDNLVDILEVPLLAAAIGFAVLLLAVLGLWYAAERTLSIHTIDTPRREVFYWLAILLAFGLGTAAGGLGHFPYAVTALAATGLTVAIAVAYRFLRLGGVPAFWLAFVTTQPLGTTLGAYLAQPAEFGGRNLGASTTTVLTVTAIAVLIAYLSVTHRDQPSLDNATSWAGPARRGSAAEDWPATW
jgi:uncharacterized membrane-anchored protein